jgi:hypothetical protein
MNISGFFWGFFNRTFKVSQGKFEGGT